MPRGRAARSPRTASHARKPPPTAETGSRQVDARRCPLVGPQVLAQPVRRQPPRAAELAGGRLPQPGAVQRPEHRIDETLRQRAGVGMADVVGRDIVEILGQHRSDKSIDPLGADRLEAGVDHGAGRRVQAPDGLEDRPQRRCAIRLAVIRRNRENGSPFVLDLDQRRAGRLARRLAGAVRRAGIGQRDARRPRAGEFRQAVADCGDDRADRLDVVVAGQGDDDLGAIAGSVSAAGAGVRTSRSHTG